MSTPDSVVPAALAEPAAPAVSRGRILVVDSDPDAACFTIHVLATRGQFEVTHTSDPSQALRLAGSQPWDLVLTDAEVPGMSGLDLLNALRQAAPGLPVAVVTAHEIAGHAITALRAGADEFAEKPVRPQQLVAMAAVLIGRGRAARAAAR